MIALSKGRVVACYPISDPRSSASIRGKFAFPDQC
jgi:hypothetical protein